MYRPGLMNLWHMCPKRHTGRLPWRMAFAVVPCFLFPLPSQPLYTVKNTVYKHIWLCTDCICTTAASKKYCKWNTFTPIRSGVMYWVGIYDWQWHGKYVTLDQTFYSPLNKPLTQVSESEPCEHPLPSTKVVAVFLLPLNGWHKIFLLTILVICDWTVNTFWHRPIEGNNKCLHTEVKILRYVTKIHTLINWTVAFPWF